MLFTIVCYTAVTFLFILFVAACNKLSLVWFYSKNYMTGKVVIVTGANTGIGFETALNLAKRGAKVYLACRDDKRGLDACEEIIKRTSNNKVYYRKLDLASFDSVRSFVKNFKESEVKLDVLINNAGMSGLHDKYTQDGIIYDMQANYFGPFLLTILLIPLLKKAECARIINVSSKLHVLGRIDFDTINEINKAYYSGTLVYSNSKLCNVLITNELARRLEGTGITANSLHPGAVKTEIYRRYKVLGVVMNFLFGLFCKSPLEGAQTTLYLAVSDEVQYVTGKYFRNCREARMGAPAKDEKEAVKLWAYSEKMVGLAQDERI